MKKEEKRASTDFLSTDDLMSALAPRAPRHTLSRHQFYPFSLESVIKGDQSEVTEHDCFKVASIKIGNFPSDLNLND